ncbi:MAG: hypothetical protein Q9226_006424, partial [Calogaya cf. arnoldii]
MASPTPPPETSPPEAPPLGTPPVAPGTPPIHQHQDETSEHIPPPTSTPLEQFPVSAALEKSREIRAKNDHQKPSSSHPLRQALKAYLSQSNNHIHHLNR